MCLFLQTRDAQQVDHRTGQFPETVQQLILHLVVILVRADQRDALIDIQLLHFVYDIAIRNIRIQLQIDGRLEGFFLLLLSLRLLHRLSQHLAVQLIAHGLHVTGLLRPQDIAGAAQLQVPHGDLYAAAKLRIFPDGLQPLFRHLRQHAVPAVHQECGGRPGRSSHAPAQLIQLAQAKAVRVVDDDGIHVGDIQAGLYDSRRHQHVRLAAHEFQHDLLQFPLLHLPVGKDHVRVRHQRLNVPRDLTDGLNLIVDVIYLPAPGQFAGDCLPHQLIVIFHDIGLDGLPVQRRLRQNAHIPDADHAHMKRTGDGRGREAHHIHRLLHLLDLFLVGHTETLFLIDDQQPQILELHIFRKKPVRSDGDVRRAPGQLCQGLPLFLGRTKAAEKFHPHRVVLHPLQEGIVVLLRQDGRRYQIRHLLAVLHRLKGSPQRNLRLPVAHVPADQAVHDLCALHVFLAGFYGLQLILRLLKGELLLKFALPDRIRGVHIAPGVSSGGVQAHQIRRDILDRAAHPCLCLLPVLPAQTVQLGHLLGPGLCIFLHQVHLCHRHVQIPAVPVGDH